MKKTFLLLLTNIFYLFYTQSKPPESYSLIRGVNENINLNSGNIDLSIPLFEIPINNLKLTNALSYESRGFVPHIPSNYVGQNWNLLQLGKITRESHRIDPTTVYTNLLGVGNTAADHSNPKDYYRNDCINSFFISKQGDIAYKKDIYDAPYSKDYYATMQFPNTFGYNGKSYSYDSDKFYFDFMDYKGYFVIDNEGNPIVYCETGTLKVDIYDYGCHDIFGNITFSQLKMTDDKGNQYIFGGSTNELDINYSYGRALIENIEYVDGDMYFRSKETKTNYIDSWLLKKIILTNGKTIDAFYQPADLTILNNFRGNYNVKTTNYNSWGSPKTEDNIGFPSKQELVNNNLTISFTRTLTELTERGYCTPACSLDKYLQVDTYTKKAVLDSIKIDDITISYKYDLSLNPSDLTNKFLKKIVVKQKNKNIKNVDLLYEDLGLNNKRTFLKEINSSNQENILFEYYNTKDFPPLKNSDYATNSLGYWTGEIDPTYDNTRLSENFTAYDTGLLKKVIYPTKGNTSYFYEHGDYSKIYKYVKDFENPPVLYNENKYVNAPRIYKKIESSFSDNIETYYTYKNNDGTSSGIIDGAVYDIFTFHSNKNVSPNLNSINSLRYSTVKVENKGKGSTKYLFSDRISNPDIITSKVFKNPNPNICKSPLNNWKEDNRLYLSKQYERGKILREEIYDESNFKIKETINDYSNFLNKFPSIDLAQGCTNCKLSDLNYYIRTTTYNEPCYIQTMYVPVIPYLLTKKTIKEYSDKNNPNKYITSIQDIGYTDDIIYLPSRNYFWHLYPISEKISAPSLKKEKRILYSFDLLKKENLNCPRGICTFFNGSKIGEQYGTSHAMLFQNIFTPLLEITKNNSNKYSLKEYLYDANSLSIPKKIRTSLLGINLDFDNYKINTGDTNEEISNDFIDNKLNILQQTDKTGKITTTIWGYNQTQPIAKIEGITYAELASKLGFSSTNTGYLSLDIVSKSNANLDASTEQSLINALDLFRNHPALSNYQITTYTYNPLIGVTSITPPSGVREIYKYDSANRLESVKDVNGNLLKEYQYRYKN
ncbi:hypothetical protein [Elizabethkingia anophelis]|uniref:hypothetical protein n=1 Tax=Elizabethkingia anophelis TaxID=1117645 RepID=UPI0012B2FD90|nr:hypothetical protein [Elizabethkingia anophelis]QGN23518.1 hypothetical protein GJV56_12985 [Elizabethkingia anophelis]QNV10163.1 hypothetical protein EIY88_12950 [Elizabethkingia anophelis]UTF88309.1 hypothetical protein J2N93_13045 [Elizabethkingia anophelis]UTF99211.1 hypothetical protein J2O04_13160 [Elizabethkingia anophelis]UTG02945.1 hypothetical protein J2O03_13040 [Elizabethkingia anophelis]